MTTFSVALVPSPLGTLLVVTDGEARVRALDFPDYEARMRRLLGLHYGAGRVTVTTGHAPATVRSAIDAFFAGALEALDTIAVRTGGTPFQQRVWAALRRIPAGSTMSYGGLAAALGCPRASRAVGLANGANPVVVVVPCHRVIGADGTLTGYGGGIARKQWLLEHEARWRPARPFRLEEVAP